MSRLFVCMGRFQFKPCVCVCVGINGNIPNTYNKADQSNDPFQVGQLPGSHGIPCVPDIDRSKLNRAGENITLNLNAAIPTVKGLLNTTTANFIFFTTDSNGGIKFNSVNLSTTNGVIHSIDAALKPKNICEVLEYNKLNKKTLTL